MLRPTHALQPRHHSPLFQNSNEIEVCGHKLTGSDITLRYEFDASTESKYTAHTDRDMLVLIDCTSLRCLMCAHPWLTLAGIATQSAAMVQEGLAREFVNRVQKLRKSGGIRQADKVHWAVQRCFPCVLTCGG